MRIADWFRPKWRHSDTAVRLSAVERVTKQTILCEIALGEESASCGTAALKRLSDPHLLGQTAQGAKCPEVRRAALERVIDQAIIAHVSCNDEDWTLRRTSVERLTDQLALARVARNDGRAEVRTAAVQRLTDQSVLAELAVNDENWGVRDRAVTKLTDQLVLAAVATNDTQAVVRSTAVQRLTDQSILARVARTDTFFVREAAVNRITDQRVLMDLMATESDAAVRTEIVRRLDGPEFLRAVAMTDRDGNVVRAALDRIGDDLPFLRDFLAAALRAAEACLERRALLPALTAKYFAIGPLETILVYVRSHPNCSRETRDYGHAGVNVRTAALDLWMLGDRLLSRTWSTAYEGMEGAWETSEASLDEVSAESFGGHPEWQDCVREMLARLRRCTPESLKKNS